MTPELLALLTRISSPNASTSTPPPPYTSASQSPHATSTSRLTMPPEITPASAAPISITLDTSIRIIGHCNTIHFPNLATTDPAKLAAVVTVALKAHESSEGKGGGVKVQGGLNVCGSRNVVVMGGAVGRAGMKKDVDTETSKGAAAGGTEKGPEEGQAVFRRKRKADEAESVQAPEAKRTATGC
ncbi:MAG: hypothetical protein Q9187_000582 [Circinaria calcarea]